VDMEEPKEPGKPPGKQSRNSWWRKRNTNRQAGTSTDATLRNRASPSGSSGSAFAPVSFSL
jgi:hypothetical protein